MNDRSRFFRALIAQVLVAFLFLAAFPLLAFGAEPASTDKFDVIIKGGTLYDGTGEKPRVIDVAIRGDRIVGVGNFSPKQASTVIDAKGMAVAPGFINMLSWSTESLIEDGHSQSEIRQGVTTQIMGEGWSMGPLNDRMKQRIISEQKDIKYEIKWNTLAEYLTYLEQRGVSPNVAPISARLPSANTSSVWKTSSRRRSSWNRCASWCAAPWRKARSALAPPSSMRLLFTPRRRS